jgi:hypothetical protein
MLLLATACSVAAAAHYDPLSRHFGALQAQLDPRAQSALERIPDRGRQLLAARAYLRAGTSLDARWSWTQEEIDQYAGSAAQTGLEAEIARVREVFEQQNPGYTLFVNPAVRSLDLQLQRWNENRSVGQAALHLEAVMRTAVGDPSFPAHGTAAATARFAALLKEHRPRPIPTLASPGLSAHGQMSAVDFQVRQGSRTIAGPDSSQVGTIWIGRGWRDRLKAAVTAASTKFIGPLVSPAEPWHYDYQPEGS